MAWNKDTHLYTWKDLEGHVAPEILCAPRTIGDPSSEWPAVHARVIGYLVRNVVGKHWAAHLAACRRERSWDSAIRSASAHVIDGTRKGERTERDYRQNSIGDDTLSGS